MEEGESNAEYFSMHEKVCVNNCYTKPAFICLVCGIDQKWKRNIFLDSDNEILLWIFISGFSLLNRFQPLHYYTYLHTYCIYVYLLDPSVTHAMSLMCWWWHIWCHMSLLLSPHNPSLQALPRIPHISRQNRNNPRDTDPTHWPNILQCMSPSISPVCCWPWY